MARLTRAARRARRRTALRAGLAVAVILVARPWPGPQPIPFVGCASDGTAGHVAPPEGAPKTVALRDLPWGTLAWYRGDAGPGVFAPRGWKCRQWDGSFGSTLVVTPEPIISRRYPPPKIRGPAVELEFAAARASSRFTVAAYAARLFPQRATGFVERVRREGLLPASTFRPGAYGGDALTYPDASVAEFTTPANQPGLGTGNYLDPTADPVRGVAILDDSNPDAPDITIVRVRLGAGMRAVEDAIVRLSRPAAASAGQAAALAGEWRGASTCVGGLPACQDEQAAYRIEASGGAVIVRGTRYAPGGPVEMGDLTCSYAAAAATAVCAVPQGTWRFWLADGRLEGSLTLPDGSVVRQVLARRPPPR